MARTLVSLGLFSAVALFAGAMTVSGLSYTADTVAKLSESTPFKTQKLKPSYIAYMPEEKAEALTTRPRVKAEAFNIAKSVPVFQVVPTNASSPLVASPAPNFTHIVAVRLPAR